MLKDYKNRYDYTTWFVNKYPVIRQLYSLGNGANQCIKIENKKWLKHWIKKIIIELFSSS